MNFRTGLGLASAVLLLTGCAATPQRAIPVNTTALSPSTRIGVVMTAVPQVNTSLPGAGCLLCAAAAEIANSSLTTYAKTLPYEGLDQLDKKLAEVLVQRGLNAKALPEHVDLSKLPKDGATDHAPRNFKALAQKYGVDKIIVLDITGVGFVRTYNAYFPTSDPKGWVAGSAYTVDAATNALDWYNPIDVQRAATGNWDEAPKFPGLTNAYFQAIEMAKDSCLVPFRDSALGGIATPVADAAPAAVALPATPAATTAAPATATVAAPASVAPGAAPAAAAPN